MLRSLLALACVACPLGAFAQSVDIPAELWDRPRTGRAVLEQENVRRAINLGLEKPDAQIVIHHATGQEPLLQAEELKSWLTALAIDSRRIALRADGAAGLPMRLEIVQ
jgi:hypothetical protein